MSGRETIPSLIHAKCPVCGSGHDYPASVLTGADSQSNIDSDAQKDTLVWFQGLLMCLTCKQNKINRQQSEVSAERHTEEQSFRDSAGFRRTIS